MDNQNQSISNAEINVSDAITNSVVANTENQLDSSHIEKPQKKKKGALITLICILIIILLSGGAFATVALISNSPENIIKGAINNLMNSKQISIDGALNVSSKYLGTVGVKSFSIDMDSKNNASSGYTSTATIKVDFVDGSEMAIVDFSEVMLKDGVFYLKVNGIKKLFYDTYYDYFASMIRSSLQSKYTYGLFRDCYYSDSNDNSYRYCSDLSENKTVPASYLEDSTAKAMAIIGEIIDIIDDSWFEFSIEDMLNHKFVSDYLDPITRRGIIAGYNCSVEKINNFSNYADEFSNLYNKYPFFHMESGQDFFYNITLRPDALANYSNEVINTDFFTDLAECAGISSEYSNNFTSSVSAEDISDALEYFPEMSAKFDGFFNHHLTEFKLAKDNDYYTLSSNFKFSYPNDISVSAPNNSRPIMDAVQIIFEKISEISNLFSY